MANKFDIYDNFISPEVKDFIQRVISDTEYDDTAKAEALRYIYRDEVFKKDFLALVFLLGYRDIGAFHYSLIRDIVDIEYPRKLWLWARSHFKSSLITEAHTIFLIINSVNIRILIGSNTLDIAKSFLNNIKKHFTSNEDFRFFFKEFCPTPNKDGKIEFGTTENFTVVNRVKILKEPTVMCAGVGTNLTGFHFDYMKLDDLVTRLSVTNEEQIKLTKDYYASLRQLFDNPLYPKEDVVGTTYHYADLYSELKENNEFKKSIVPIKNDAGEILFKERFTEEGIQKLMDDPSMSSYEFSAQYYLNPVNPKDRKFRDEWINYYDTLPEGLSEYICVDPASTQNKKSDYTVIEHWGFDSEGKCYLLNGVRDKLTSFQRIDILFNFVKNSKNLKMVKYEVLGGRHGDLEVIKERQIRDKVFFLIQETKSSHASKQDRIEQRLSGRYQAGSILWPKRLYFTSIYDGKVHDFIQDFRLEFLQFPHTSHDDILDAQSQLFEEEFILGQRIKTLDKKTGMTADDWDNFYNSMDRMKMRNPFLTLGMIHKTMAVTRVKRILSKAR